MLATAASTLACCALYALFGWEPELGYPAPFSWDVLATLAVVTFVVSVFVLTPLYIFVSWLKLQWGAYLCLGMIGWVSVLVWMQMKLDASLYGAVVETFRSYTPLILGSTGVFLLCMRAGDKS